MKLYVKVALGVVFVLAVAGILGALYLYNKQPADTSKAKADLVKQCRESMQYSAPVVIPVQLSFIQAEAR